TRFNEPELRLELRRINAVYAGTRAGDSITGTWTQGAATLPLVLSKGAASGAPRARPQEPTRPYPYSEEQVAIPNAQDSVTLAGTLTIPQGQDLTPVSC